MLIKIWGQICTTQFALVRIKTLETHDWARLCANLNLKSFHSFCGFGRTYLSLKFVRLLNMFLIICTECALIGLMNGKNTISLEYQVSIALILLLIVNGRTIRGDITLMLFTQEKQVLDWIYLCYTEQS